MVRARRRFQFALIAPAVVVSACLDAPIETSPEGSGGTGNGNGNGSGGDCTLEDQTLQPEQFEAQVLPGLIESCSARGCHAPDTAGGGYAIFGGVYESADADEHCDFVASIESFVDFADRESPGDSPIIQALDGRTPHFGGQWGEEREPRPSIEAYLETISGGGGGGGDAPGLAEFETDIQPILDNAGGQGCAEGGACHQNGAGAFTLNPEPAPGSTEMRANYDQVVAQSNPADPDNSPIVVQATASHFGSPEVSAAEQSALVDWISSLSE